MEEIFEPIGINDYKPIRDLVFEQLRNAILDGQLAPGERLVEREIANKMMVSRTPVREAIRKLEREGLVSTVLRKGVVVKAMSRKDVLEIYTIREVLEGLAARLAAGKINKTQGKKLQALVEEMQRHRDNRDMEKLNKIHREFHDFIYRVADSPRLYEMIETLVEYVVKFSKAGYTIPGRLEDACAEHRELTAALIAHDENLAEELARRHIANSREAYIQEFVPDERMTEE